MFLHSWIFFLSDRQFLCLKSLQIRRQFYLLSWSSLYRQDNQRNYYFIPVASIFYRPGYFYLNNELPDQKYENSWTLEFFHSIVCCLLFSATSFFCGYVDRSILFLFPVALRICRTYTLWNFHHCLIAENVFPCLCVDNTDDVDWRYGRFLD